MIRNTLPFDVYGLPTISVPCGFTRSGLPIGLQISGPRLGEARVLALATRVRAGDGLAQARARAAVIASTWTCPTCGTVVVSHFCPTCGEQSPDDRELTLRGLATQIIHTATSVDGKLLRSFVRLLRRPGDLTVAYLQGRRKPFIGPVPLYFMANLLFFASESLLGGAIVSTSLDTHLSRQPWSPWAQVLVPRRLEQLGTTLDAYAPVFDRAVALHARSLIILMALAFAVLPWLLFRGRGKPFAAHAVFSLHLYSFLLLLLCAANVIPALDARFPLDEGRWQVVDNAVAMLVLLASAVYIYVATAKVYDARGPARVAQAAVLTLGVGSIVLGYRFALFLLTLYTAS